jgi:hypothetical protein
MTLQSATKAEPNASQEHIAQTPLPLHCCTGIVHASVVPGVWPCCGDDLVCQPIFVWRVSVDLTAVAGYPTDDAKMRQLVVDPLDCPLSETCRLSRLVERRSEGLVFE